MSGEQQLAGKTVLVLGGTAGIGLETAKLARAKGAELVLVARNPDRLHEVGLELGARIAAFDVTDLERLDRFFADLDTSIDHLLFTGPGPQYGPVVQLDPGAAGRHLGEHLAVPLAIARNAVGCVAPGGTLLFMGGTPARRP